QRDPGRHARRRADEGGAARDRGRARLTRRARPSSSAICHAERAARRVGLARRHGDHRMGLIDLLGLKPPKSRRPGAATVATNQAATPASAAMLDDATKYAAAKQLALDALATLVEPSAAADRQRI